MTSRRQVIIGGAAWVLAGCGGSTTIGGGGSTPAAPPPSAPDVAADWPLATPASQGVPDSAMTRLLADVAAVPNARGLVVVRNGSLIGEGYFNNAGAGTLHHVRSITKSVHSLMIGRALDDGHLPGLQASVATLLPEAVARQPSTQLASLTLERILTMRTGVQFDDNTQWDQLAGAPDALSFVLGLPVNPVPPAFHYDSAGAHLPSPILQRAYGMPVDQLVQRDLFQPLGIARYDWTRDASGVPFGSFGLQLRTRDTAKLAQLVLDNGAWAGKQLVPAAWIATSTAPNTAPGLFADGAALTKAGYGYLWWTGTLGGKEIVLGWGAGGQFAVIVRSHRLIVQTNASHNVSGAQQDVQEGALLQAVGTFLAAL